MPKLYNIKNRKQVPVPAGAVYVGRPGKWGNPWTIRKNGNRLQVIEKYRQWVLSRPDLIVQIRRELRGKDLVCFCVPKPCHGNVLIEIANRYDPDIERLL